MRVHDLTELIDRVQSVNGSSTFICPVKKTSGSFRLENIGTLNVEAAAPSV
jgi:hypothetical protein